MLRFKSCGGSSKRILLHCRSKARPRASDMRYFTQPFTHPPVDARLVHTSWFEAQRLPQSNSKSIVDGWHDETVDVLKAFHGNDKNAEETAFALTRSISSSPILDLGSYSNEMLDAMAKLPDKLFNSEMTSSEGGDEPLTWADFPYFAAGLGDTEESIQPGQLCRISLNPESTAAARMLYLRFQDMEVQCVARHIFKSTDSLVYYISNTLEKPIDELDQQVMPAVDRVKGHSFNSYNEATAYHQVKLEWNIPAVASWFRYNAQKIYDLVHAGVRLDKILEKSEHYWSYSSER
ncbi:uncharacterized protein K489DRAFT_405123 [Dissoconium aciculare CBS 342.82]|uniref:Uncharacterized protein n=1 Tax=Dissoconium aciculare CBS 342.82 TaxID=1314786 RepID=A0A6J3LSW4_9PEZI|nr:uncharacterized protein K489DRAFT_405123 [Dissoconium aciculare CBS 342.82]KAF1818379.1 hypothetical protein K489DRAFT_405123 [Dissoconium aciculare CBS 342.82]